MIEYEELKKFENKEKEISKVEMLKATILGATVASVVVVLAPVIQDNALFLGITIGSVVSFLTYIYSIERLKNKGIKSNEK